MFGKKKVNRMIDVAYDESMKAYGQHDMKRGRVYENLADQLYKDNYHVLHPRLAKKMRR